MHSIFGIYEKALGIRNERSQILANNLANADTPNYKARDIDWRSEMKAASEDMMRTPYKPDLKMTNSRHIEGFADFSTDSFLKYRNPTQASLDGNTVETHAEKARFMENAMRYQATLTFIDGKIAGIRGALKGQ